MEKSYLIRINGYTKQKLDTLRFPQGRVKLSYNSAIKQLLVDLDYIQLIRACINAYTNRNGFNAEGYLEDMQKVISKMLEKRKLCQQGINSDIDKKLESFKTV